MVIGQIEDNCLSTEIDNCDFHDHLGRVHCHCAKIFSKEMLGVFSGVCRDKINNVEMKRHTTYCIS